jgi:RNA polymerase sigma factor (sigma-70 family)
VDVRRDDDAFRPDDELAALALKGCAPAWSELARRHTHRVIVALLARGLPIEMAEDLAQEAWVRLIERQRAGRLEELRLPGLAIAQAGWLAMEAIRTERRRDSLAGGSLPLDAGGAEPRLSDPASDPARQTFQRERMEAVQRELRACPERAQQVFLAVYGPRARRHADVARDLGLSLQRVRQILCEVRARMRRRLEELEGEDEPWNT